MSDLVWWTLFVVLTLLLAVFTVKLCHRVVSDVWCSDQEVSEDAQNIEDLTRYRNDFRTIFKDVQVKNESEGLMMTKEYELTNQQNGTTPTLTTFGKERNVEMHALVEDDESKNSEAKIEEEEEKKNDEEKILIEEVPIDGDSVDEKIEEKGKDSVDGEKDYFTLEEQRMLDHILKIQNDTDTYAKQIPFCLGGKNHMTYYDINEKFLMNLIGLQGIDCKSNEKLKRRKQMVSMYIQECQNELKKRADVDVL